MVSALLNIAGGLGMFAILVIALRWGTWMRRGYNRLPVASLLLASVSATVLASALERYGNRAQNLSIAAAVGFGLAVLLLVVWIALQRRK